MSIFLISPIISKMCIYIVHIWWYWQIMSPTLNWTDSGATFLTSSVRIMSPPCTTWVKFGKRYDWDGSQKPSRSLVLYSFINWGWAEEPWWSSWTPWGLSWGSLEFGLSLSASSSLAILPLVLYPSSHSIPLSFELSLSVFITGPANQNMEIK